MEMINRKKAQHDVERGQSRSPASSAQTNLSKGGTVVGGFMLRGAVALVALGLVLFTWTQITGSSSLKYAVVIDAGSTGSRVHVYRFKTSSGTVVLEDELFVQKKPGLSAYATEPEKGAESLVPLLTDALNVIPASQITKTPIRIGATAGLRMLPGNQADDLLQASRDLLRKKYNFKPFKDEAVSIMSGSDEGKFAWLAVNMLSGKLGAPPEETVGVIDLGGGSVQMMRALDTKSAETSPDGYVTPAIWQGKEYKLYVHSFLGYGLKAGRMAVLEQENAAASCMPKFAAGSYNYNNKAVDATGQAGSDFSKCRSVAVQALGVSKPCELTSGCAFNGKWGAIDGESNGAFYLLSYLYERIEQAGAGKFEPDEGLGQATVEQLKEAATEICQRSLDEIKSSSDLHPEDPSYFCLDLSFIHALLSEGFRISDFRMAKKFEIDNIKYEAAWSLGAALEML
mmetsp:Transcript_18829/g.46171  ORF Transcript_18829/g.46171 Transcript_18829/m.46171 type:complete len:456 (-) Transcript_18829:168-1535(-)